MFLVIKSQKYTGAGFKRQEMAVFKTRKSHFCLETNRLLLRKMLEKEQGLPQIEVSHNTKQVVKGSVQENFSRPGLVFRAHRLATFQKVYVGSSQSKQLCTV